MKSDSSQSGSGLTYERSENVTSQISSVVSLETERPVRPESDTHRERILLNTGVYVDENGDSIIKCTDKNKSLRVKKGLVDVMEPDIDDEETQENMGGFLY